MNKRDLGRQREDRILVAEDIPHEIQKRHFQFQLTCGVSFGLELLKITS
jgi:hypothetical protein